MLYAVKIILKFIQKNPSVIIKHMIVFYDDFTDNLGTKLRCFLQGA